MDTLPYLSLFMALILLFSRKGTAEDPAKGIIGAIVDHTSRIGKEEKVAMEMAIDDFRLYSNGSLRLHIENSQREPIQAALAAMDLINKHQVQAITGPRTWEEASLVAEVGSQAHVPILSCASATPQWASERWPFLIQASPNQQAEIEAVTAIIRSWGWHRVAIIYEDIDSVASEVIPHFTYALQDIGAEISRLVALPPFASSLSKELTSLKKEQCRVFVVHSSLSFATHMFQQANQMGMIEKGYVWITMDTITSLAHSLNASTISTMQGVAYDAIWTVAQALVGNNLGGQHILEQISLTSFHGLTGLVEFTGRRIAPLRRFQIVNMIGRSYRELGFWTSESGFTDTMDEKLDYNPSMRTLGQVFWPGGPWSIPTGWTLPSSYKTLKIGVPIGSVFKFFVNPMYDSENNLSFSGLTIKIFEAILEYLPYYLPHQFIPFNGSYDALVLQLVHPEKFDAVVGDVAITAERNRHAEFTYPYTESRLVMIVPVQTRNRAWLFIKPFTKSMWALTTIINIYNGFVIWLIERNHCSDLKGSLSNQIGVLLWLAFTTLFSLQGQELHSNLSRMAMVMWLFVALVITQSYTANLASMLTVETLEPTVDDIESLKISKAVVGCSRGAFVANYLEKALGFHTDNIRRITAPEEYAQALRNGEIAAAFLEAPLAKLFLARYCKGFA
ncbi:Glutamate receptor 2.7 [Vitis vinifera]|uniref:Glutamate receptor 2.7 n=1 Tax=Vitis vinifera TaxID=29760 RepID=A0A438E5E3_VITVI|nr:Glutamate receptor 2.7 [Vitis vinifera]